MEQIIKTTVDELKANPPQIIKKFILIDSSLYTDEAYEYLLELINETDSIAFIKDTKRIYTHGQYFGGDLWEDTLCYFGQFQIIDSNSDELIATIQAEVANDSIRFASANNITIIAEDEYVHGNKIKTIKFNYNLEDTVNTEKVSIDDPTAIYNLEVIDKKLKINKYVPIRVEVPESNEIELDTNIESIKFPIFIYGTSENKNIYVTTTSGDEATVTDDMKWVESTIHKNLDTDFLIVYSDEQTEGYVHHVQKFGYGLLYSNTEITKDNFFSVNRYISSSSCSGTIVISQGDDEYGWFACPSVFNPLFTDHITGLVGGWKKVKTLTAYSDNISYDVWRTENAGLGEIIWDISKFEKPTQTTTVVGETVYMDRIDEVSRRLGDAINIFNHSISNISDEHQSIIENQAITDAVQNAEQLQINSAQDERLNTIEETINDIKRQLEQI